MGKDKKIGGLICCIVRAVVDAGLQPARFMVYLLEDVPFNAAANTKTNQLTRAKDPRLPTLKPVSYTHLTLPTIYAV